MAQLANDVYIHLNFDAEKFKAELREAIKAAIVDVVAQVDRYLTIEQETHGQ